MRRGYPDAAGRAQRTALGRADGEVVPTHAELRARQREQLDHAAELERAEPVVGDSDDTVAGGWVLTRHGVILPEHGLCASQRRSLSPGIRWSWLPAPNGDRSMSSVSTDRPRRQRRRARALRSRVPLRNRLLGRPRRHQQRPSRISCSSTCAARRSTPAAMRPVRSTSRTASSSNRRRAAIRATRIFVVYCAGPHCNGAHRGAVRLARLGRPVKLMIGGITGWVDEGFALRARSKSVQDSAFAAKAASG